MYYLYILRSLKDLGYYIGVAEDVNKRLKYHNSGKTISTKSRTPLILVCLEKYEYKTDARKREIFLKKNYQERSKILKQLGFNVK